MENIFLQLLNMSITAGWLVLAVLVLRLVFRNAPRWIHCTLWALVAVRLICPISIESAFSLVPSTQPVDTILSTAPIVNSDAPVTDTTVTPAVPVIPDAPVVSSPDIAPQAASITVAEILTIVWLAGMAALVLYAVVTTLRLHRQVRESVRLQGNVWQCDRIATPFILGVFRPRIFLPTTLTELDTSSVVAHERAHLKRGDHWWKPLGFVLLSIYWFNPLLWLGYILLCRDIEAACDEKVIQDMDVSQRKSYSQTILACSAPRHLITACPVAFGETAVKSRVKTVLNYKKPAFWLVLVAVIASIAVAVCLLTDPKSTVAEEPGSVTEEFEGTVALTSRFNWGVGYLDEDTHTAMKTQYAESDLPIFVMRNTTDLENFITTCDGENRIFTRSSTPGSDRATQMREVYTEEYFKDHVVLAVYYMAASYMFEPEIVAAEYTENGTKLTVMVDVYIPCMVNDALGGYMMMTAIDRATAEKVTSFGAAVRADIPENQYVASFEKNRYMYQMRSTSYIREAWRAWLGEEELDMNALVKTLGWENHGHKAQYSPYIGAINMAGETYYVNDKYDMLSTKEKTALLNADQSTFVRSLFTKSRNGKVGPVPYLEGNDPYKSEEKPYKDYTYLYGHYMGHNKAEHYVILDVVWAENADLVGKKVMVSLNELDGFGLPGMGAVIEIPYDGTVGEQEGFPLVVSQGWENREGLNYGNPREEYPDVTGGNFTGKVLQVTDDSMLMESYDKSLFDTVWVNYSCFYPEMKPVVGDEYKVNYADGVMETAPPKVTGEGIKAVSYATERENNFIGDDRAIEIAAAYWKEQLGDNDPKEGYVIIHIAPTFERPMYSMTLRELLELEDDTTQFNPIDGIQIHAVTGEIALPDGTKPEESKFITETRAIEIASEYWKIQPGDRDPETGYLMTIMAWETPTREDPYYRMALRWLVETEGGTGYYSTVDTVCIDAVTEGIIVPGGENLDQPIGEDLDHG